jgi:uncharacterized protein with GYD domain
MKYILLGTLSTESAGKHKQRVESAKAKLKELGIKLDTVYYTQGQYDFVDVVDAPDPEALLTFSVWYVSQGYGHIQSMPAFDAKTFAQAVSKA